MTRIWTTNRWGFHSSSIPSNAPQRFGFSKAPYDRLNLGLKVGDEPHVVSRSRSALTAACGLDQILFMDQIHSAQMVQGEPASDGSPCDGIFISRSSWNRQVGLAVQVADCVPLILSSEEMIAAVHIGREGLLKGMAESALTTMESEGVSMAELNAVIGPSICGGCYQLSDELFDLCATSYPATSHDVRDKRVDVAAGVISVLEERGVAWRWFSGERECVSCDHDYFSYRRERQTGRQVMVVAW